MERTIPPWLWARITLAARIMPPGSFLRNSLVSLTLWAGGSKGKWRHAGKCLHKKMKDIEDYLPKAPKIRALHVKSFPYTLSNKVY